MVSNRVFCTCTSANRRHASHPSRTDETTHRFVARRVACVMRAFQHAIAMVSAVHVVPCRCTVGAPSFPPQKKSRFFFARVAARTLPSTSCTSSCIASTVHARACVTCDVDVRIPRRPSVVARSETRLWPSPGAFFRGFDAYPPTFGARSNPARRFRRRCARRAPPEARVRLRRCCLGSFRSS